MVAVIGDLVRSRQAPDRAAVQRTLEHALAEANNLVGVVEPLNATVGDEFQGMYDNLFGAIEATLVVRASMPVPYDVRFGIGIGGIGSVTWAEDDPVSGFRRQDGPAWWAARDAIEHVADARWKRNIPRTLRTWIAQVPEDADPRARFHQDVTIGQGAEIQALNAYLTVRDHVVGRMDARDRRILHHLLVNRSLTDIATAEGVSVSAISQRVQRSGTAELMYSRDQLLLDLLAREADR